MASGRLGHSTISPYTSCVVYCNNSGNPASISVSSQVISSDGNTELTVGIGTTTSIVTSGVATVATGASFSEIVGPTFACPTSYTYCGSFVTSQCDAFYSNYLAAESLGVHTTTSFDCCLALCTAGCCCKTPITGEIINPALRLGECAFTGISSSNLLGFYTAPQGCFVYTHTEYTGKDVKAAATLIGIPCSCCCSTLFTDISKCSQSYFWMTYDWYAIKCGYGAKCCPARICYPDVMLGFNGGTAVTITPIYWTGCCNSTWCTFCGSNICVTDGVAAPSGCCRTIFTEIEACWGTCSCHGVCCWIGRCNTRLKGVNLAASGGVATVVLNYTCSPQRYTFFPFVYNLSGSASWTCWFCRCGTCGSGLINLFTQPSSQDEYAIKWFAYNPTKDCTYMMLDDSTRSGIYSINRGNLFKFLNKSLPTDNYCICCGYIDDMTCYFTKVSDIPEVFNNSNLCCIKNLYKTAEDSWGIAVKNKAGTCFETFNSSDLINWTNSTVSYSQPLDSDRTKVLYNSSAGNCLELCCNCFYGNVGCSGITDYKVIANNYERTGVVISDGESIVVNNNSCYTMNSQVWGYEG